MNDSPFDFDLKAVQFRGRFGAALRGVLRGIRIYLIRSPRGVGERATPWTARSDPAGGAKARDSYSLVFTIVLTKLLLICSFPAAGQEMLGNPSYPMSTETASPPSPASPFSEDELRNFFRYFANVNSLKLDQTFPLEEQKFCEIFHSDLREMRHIRFVKPVATAALGDDVTLEKYANRCPNLPLRRFLVDPNSEDFPESVQEAYHLVYYARGDLSLYLVNIDDDPITGDKYIVYGDRLCSKEDPLRCTNPYYKTVDFQHCNEYINTDMPYPFDTRPEHEKQEDNNVQTDPNLEHGYASIVEYRDRHYFLSAGFGGVPHGGGIDSLILSSPNRLWPDDSGRRRADLCIFSIPPD